MFFCNCCQQPHDSWVTAQKEKKSFGTLLKANLTIFVLFVLCLWEYDEQSPSNLQTPGSASNL